MLKKFVDSMCFRVLKGNTPPVLLQNPENVTPCMMSSLTNNNGIKRTGQRPPPGPTGIIKYKCPTKKITYREKYMSASKLLFVIIDHRSRSTSLYCFSKKSMKNQDMPHLKSRTVKLDEELTVLHA